MSRKKRRPRQFALDAMTLIAADDELSAHHAGLIDDGYALAPKARCCLCRDNSITAQLCWTKRRPGGSTTETMTIAFDGDTFTMPEWLAIEKGLA